MWEEKKKLPLPSQAESFTQICKIVDFCGSGQVFQSPVVSLANWDTMFRLEARPCAKPWNIKMVIEMFHSYINSMWAGTIIKIQLAGEKTESASISLG